MTVGELNVEIGAKLTGLERQLQKMEGKIGQAGKKSERTAKASFGNIQDAIVTAFSVLAVEQFVGAIISARGEYERFGAVLTNTLGSQQAAGEAMEMIQSFASRTPFAVNELTDSYVRLVNQGFKPSRDEMRKLGDLASSTGKSFIQLSEAIIDAQVGEFERLKEFGIRAQKEGDRVIFTFKGVKTEAEFTEQAIQDYILSLGDLQGVSGSMSAISETLEGRISNLGDAYNNLLITLGEGDAMKETVTGMSLLVRYVDGLLQSLQSVDFEDTWLSQFYNVAKNVPGIAMIFDRLSKSIAEGAEFMQFIDYMEGVSIEAKETQKELNGVAAAIAAVYAAQRNPPPAKPQGRARESMINLPTRGIPSVLPTSEGGGLGSSDELARRLQEEAESAALLTAQLQEAAMVGEAFGGVLQSSFEAALINGESFFWVMENGLKNMVYQLASAAAASALLAAILAPLGFGSFGSLFGSFFGGSGGGGGMGGNFGAVFTLLGTNQVAQIDRTSGQQSRYN